MPIFSLLLPILFTNIPIKGKGKMKNEEKRITLSYCLYVE